MKKIATSIVGLLLLLLTGCGQESWKQEEQLPPTERKEYVLNVAVPLMSAPVSRSITNDLRVMDYVLWIFEKEKLVAVVTPRSTYLDEEGNWQKVVTYDGSSHGLMTLKLSPDYTQVRVMMIANYDIPSPPTLGITWNEAETLLKEFVFTYDGRQELMPLYGTSGISPIHVKVGVSGVIQLKRALAKVIVDAGGASDHFQMEEAYVYRVTTEGHLFPLAVGQFPVPQEQARISCDITQNVATVYVPEIRDVSPDDAAKTCIIIGGRLNDQGTIIKRYFRMDFIKRYKEGQNVKYAYIHEIERNHCYIFDVDYLVAGSGVATLEEACRHEAANKIEGTTITMVCEDANIMDITTDNYTFLGVTSGCVTAVLNTDETYYAAHISIATNHQEGWKMENLPPQTFADRTSWKPNQDELHRIWTTQSVWVYFEKDYYSHYKENVVLYIYSGNIRKRIEVILPNGE